MKLTKDTVCVLFITWKFKNIVQQWQQCNWNKNQMFKKMPFFITGKFFKTKIYISLYFCKMNLPSQPFDSISSPINLAKLKNCKILCFPVNNLLGLHLNKCVNLPRHCVNFVMYICNNLTLGTWHRFSISAKHFTLSVTSKKPKNLNLYVSNWCCLTTNNNFCCIILPINALPRVPSALCNNILV